MRIFDENEMKGKTCNIRRAPHILSNLCVEYSQTLYHTNNYSNVSNASLVQTIPEQQRRMQLNTYSFRTMKHGSRQKSHCHIQV